MTSDLIQQERRYSFVVVHLNRPEKLNSLSTEMRLALAESFQSFGNESDLRAIILTGAGDRAFSAGTDITELKGLDEARALELSQLGQALCERIENCPIPVIAAVNGIAAGGGCELALACHLRIASENATFRLPETRLGALPGYGGTQRLAREIGYGRALEIMLTGRTLNAREALEFGLVNQVVSNDLLATAEGLAQEISQLAPLAIRACLQAVIRGADLPLAEGLALERELFARLFASEDVREGTSAFLEKRSPVFTGK